MSENCVGMPQLRVDEYRFSRRMHSNRNLGSLNTTFHLSDNDQKMLSTQSSSINHELLLKQKT
jgi:hypothetical protein